jgi:hypothetical protein
MLAPYALVCHYVNMDSFAIGFLVGLFVGGAIGFLACGLLSMNSD